MRRFVTFVLGMIVGAGLLLAALNYHLIRAADGLHLIPKVETTLTATYVDIRNFGPADWVRQSRIAEALVKADRTDLMESSIRDSVRETIDGILAPPD